MSSFSINRAKASTAILYVVNEIPGIEEYKLYEILYFAEQYHVLKYGRLIMAEIYEKSPLGLVPILFCQGIINNDNAVKLEDGLIKTDKQPDLEDLSVSDLECLNLSISENKNGPSKFLEGPNKEVYQPGKKYDSIEEINIALDGKAEGGMLEYFKNYIENQYSPELRY